MTRAAATCAVVIPCYNGAAYLEAAVASVLAQEFGDYHLVLVDDASEDGTLALARRLSERQQHISVLALPENRGRSFARNRGAEAVASPYVTFLDQDDTYHPAFLRLTTEALASMPEVDAVKVLPRVNVDLDEVRLDAVANSLATTMVIRRYAFEFVGGWPEGQAFRKHPGGCEDIAFQDLFHACFHVALLRQQLYNHTHRPGNALDQFLKHSRVVDGELIVEDVKENAEVRAEARLLKKKLQSRLRQFVVNHLTNGPPMPAPPDHAAVEEILLRAERCQEAGDLGQAEQLCRQAIHCEPGHAASYNHLALVLTEQGKAAEALVWLRQAIRLRPQFAQVHNSLGLAYNALGRLTEAEKAYEAALLLDPLFADAHSNLGNTYKEQSKLDEALASYQLAFWLRQAEHGRDEG
jgi:Flp pilus assembly protein TadD